MSLNNITINDFVQNLFSINGSTSFKESNNGADVVVLMIENTAGTADSVDLALSSGVGGLNASDIDAYNFDGITPVDVTTFTTPITISFLAGETSKNISITLTNDATFETGEQLTGEQLAVTLQIPMGSIISPTANPTANMLTIDALDNDAEFSFAIYERGTTTMPTTVAEGMEYDLVVTKTAGTRSYDVDPTLIGFGSADFNTSDFRFLTSTLSFSDRTTSQTTVFELFSDNVAETEHFNISARVTQRNGGFASLMFPVLAYVVADSSPAMTPTPSATFSIQNVSASMLSENETITFDVARDDTSSGNVAVTLSDLERDDIRSLTITGAEFVIGGMNYTSLSNADITTLFTSTTLPPTFEIEFTGTGASTAMISADSGAGGEDFDITLSAVNTADMVDTSRDTASESLGVTTFNLAEVATTAADPEVFRLEIRSVATGIEIDSAMEGDEIEVIIQRTGYLGGVRIDLMLDFTNADAADFTSAAHTGRGMTNTIIPMGGQTLLDAIEARRIRFDTGDAAEQTITLRLDDNDTTDELWMLSLTTTATGRTIEFDTDIDFTVTN